MARDNRLGSFSNSSFSDYGALRSMPVLVKDALFADDIHNRSSFRKTLAFASLAVS